ncbi:MAG: CDP-alcohol phosphatidyltransferase family protein [Actinomycetota bacterium]|jgi:CDP-diacylglycerol--glycerol-3-phosphate 3-phosphatidyltransferase|nr:CDP-alcohol phosphatidyltransferase family protein [Acidothermales bacterium]MDQ3431660.1 CDP-alcohol phosphatidyltransferase family protein [Actinomycetota bacterium]
MRRAAAVTGGDAFDDAGPVVLNAHARRASAHVLAPLARALLRMGVSPNAVTVFGTVGTVVAAFACYPFGLLFPGSAIIAVFVLSDMVDGTMARMSGRTTTWGAYLDSTLDRVGDAAIFGGLILWFTGGGDDPVLAAVALFCLVAAMVVSYAKARAEGLGLTCDVGIAERSDRLLAILVAAGLSGLGVPYILPVGLWLLAAASAFTVWQRMAEVHRQLGAGGRGGARP